MPSPGHARGVAGRFFAPAQESRCFLIISLTGWPAGLTPLHHGGGAGAGPNESPLRRDHLAYQQKCHCCGQA